MKNYYEILGITPHASLEEIKTSHRKLALKFHPDMNKGDSFFDNMFKDVQEAYEELSNIESRKLYDIKYKTFFNETSNKEGYPKKEYNTESSKSNKKSKTKSYKKTDFKAPKYTSDSFEKSNPKSSNSTYKYFLYISIIIVVIYNFSYYINSKTPQTDDIHKESVIETQEKKDALNSDHYNLDEIDQSENLTQKKFPYVIKDYDVEPQYQEALKMLNEYYKFERRDYVYRDPMFKTSGTTIEISVQECPINDTDDEYSWKTVMSKIYFFNDGTYNFEHYSSRY